MRWSTFFKIILLILISGIVIYFIYPKYSFSYIEGGGILKGNKITGNVEIYSKGKWVKLIEKK